MSILSEISEDIHTLACLDLFGHMVDVFMTHALNCMWGILMAVNIEYH